MRIAAEIVYAEETSTASPAVGGSERPNGNDLVISAPEFAVPDDVAANPAAYKLKQVAFSRLVWAWVAERRGGGKVHNLVRFP